MRTHPHRRKGRRGRFDRRGQVSAVATLFGLLLVVLLIAEWAIAPLPTQEQNAELQHLLLVENQLGQLQSDILLEVNAHTTPKTLTAPISLGSTPIPPFGPAAAGQLSLLPTGRGIAFNAFTATPIVPTGIRNLCSSGTPFPENGGSITCTATNNSNCNPAFGDFYGNNSNITIRLKGNSACQYVVDVSGNNNIVTVLVTANGAKGLNFTLYGTGNTVYLGLKGSISPVTFWLYGANNTYGMDYGQFTESSETMTTYFVGESPYPSTCPYMNYSTTDHVGPMGISSGTSDTQYIYYYDSVGYSTSQHRISGSSNHRPTIYFQNQSLSNPIACAFNILPQGTALPLESAGGGLGIVLSNNYLGAYNLAFQGGAVISQAYGGIPVMIDPPAFTFSTNATGNSARLVMINLVATNASQSESGYSTAGITTRLLSELTFQSTVPFGAGASQLGGPTLNVSTYFPAAWSSYFGSLSSTYTGGSGAVQCYSPVAFSAPYSCLDPPAGTPVYVSVPLSVQSVTVVLATVSVVID